MKFMKVQFHKHSINRCDVSLNKKDQSCRKELSDNVYIVYDGLYYPVVTAAKCMGVGVHIKLLIITYDIFCHS